MDKYTNLNLQAVIASLTLLLWLFHKGRGKKEGFTLSIKAPYRSFHKPVSFCKFKSPTSAAIGKFSGETL